MSSPIRVPDLGVNDGIRLTAWLVEVGDAVLRGDRLVELLIPGVTFDVSAETDGTLIGKTQPLNAVVAVGDTLGWIDSS